MPIKRSITDAGHMVKDGGVHSTYSAINHPLPSVHKATSANPLPRTIKKIQDQTQLRFKISQDEPGKLTDSICI